MGSLDTAIYVNYEPVYTQLFSANRRNLPWLTKSLIKSIKKRNLLYKRAKKSGSFRSYKLARNKTLADIRSAKLSYFRKLNPRDPKKFWKAIKCLNKKPNSMPTLTLGDTTAVTESEKANLLNSYFHSCFNKSHTPITPSACLRFSPAADLLCSEDEVFDLLATLDVSKSTGPDGISARMLKFTATSITPSVTKLFNQSIIQARVPSLWKKSVIVPVPKTSDVTTPTNYRPISLLPIISKLLERHIYSLILHHLQANDILTTSQWGFLEGRSTVTALIKCSDDWLKSLEDGNDTCAIFFDYRKAFDSVPHRPLIVKLRSLGVDDCIVNWVKNYLADLPHAIQDEYAHLNLFADDFLLYRIITSAADYLLLQEMICIIEQWTSDNYLSFNTSKCKYMIISRKRNPPLPDIPLQLCGSALERVDSYKYLGVLVSCDLSWSLHIEFACQKAWRVLGLLYRRFYGQASQDSLKQLYLSLVRPHLEYASQVWDPHLAKDRNALEKVQKFACKLATSKWNSSYEELLDLTDLKPLQDRRLESKLGLLFKMVHNLCFFPDNSWSFRTNSRCNRNSNSLQLSRPFARTNAYMASFFPHTVANWNLLDNNASSYKSFMQTVSN